MKRLAIFPAIIAVVLFAGCASTQGRGIDPVAIAALDTTVLIAVRRSVHASTRATEKAANIREVVSKVRATITAESTLAALTTAVRAEVDKLELSPLDRADANDLIELLGVAIESRFPELDADRLVRVNEFLDLVLSALPPAPTAT